MLTELEDLGKLTLVTGMNNTGKSQALLGLLPYAPHYLRIERVNAEEFYLNQLMKHKDKIVDDKLNLKEININETSKEWVKKIFEDDKTHICGIYKTWLKKIFEITNYSNSSEPDRIAYNSVKSIVITALVCTEYDLIIIDKPELGLHPKMQSNLIEFLALVSSTGVRIVLETHSDHILNGARIAVLNKVLNHDDLVIYHYSRDKEKVKIPVDKKGKITQWEDDFFDQLDKDYAKLFKPIC